MDQLPSLYGIGLAPPRPLSLLEWVKTRHTIRATSSSEPGPYRLSRAPWWELVFELMDQSNPCTELVIMKSAQIGCTEACLAILLHAADELVGTSLFVAPNVELAKTFSSMRFDPCISAIPSIRAKFPVQRAREKGAQVLRKVHLNGTTVFAGAVSPTGIRGTPCRICICDDCDGFPGDAAGEGNVVEICRHRLDTWGHQRKFLINSTPKQKGQSEVESRFLMGNQMLWKMPCPGCATPHAYDFPNDFRFPPDDPDAIKWRCPTCENEYGPEFKQSMVSAGSWQATAEALEPGLISMHINALVSSWRTWQDIAKEFIATAGNPARRKSFYNLTLGLPHSEEANEVPNVARLRERAEVRNVNEIPAECYVVFGGLDVQINRWILQVIAYSDGMRSHTVSYWEILGDTSKIEEWHRCVTPLRTARWVHANGLELELETLAVDCKYQKSVAYDWYIAQQNKGTVSLMETHSYYRRGQPPVEAPRLMQFHPTTKKRLKGGVMVTHVFSPHFKRILHRSLLLDLPSPSSGDKIPDNFCHLPNYLGDGFFEGLVAETEVVKRNGKGFVIGTVWEERNSNNHSLDTWVLCRAAAFAKGMDNLRRWQIDKMQQEVGYAPPKQIALPITHDATTPVVAPPEAITAGKIPRVQQTKRRVHTARPKWDW